MSGCPGGATAEEGGDEVSQCPEDEEHKGGSPHVLDVRFVGEDHCYLWLLSLVRW